MMTEAHGLSEKSRTVLRLIADGHSYEQIVNGHPDISYLDIFQAAEEALRLAELAPDYQERLAEIKSRHPNEYEPWTDADDTDLAVMQRQGQTIDEMASYFQR